MGWLDDARDINARKAEEFMRYHADRAKNNREVAEMTSHIQITPDQAESFLRSIFGGEREETAEREPNYVRRDEHHIHIYLHLEDGSDGSGDTDARFQATADALEMLRDRTNSIAAYLEAQRQVTEQTARFEKVNERPDFYTSDVDTVFDKPIQVDEYNQVEETPLTYYLGNPDVTQEDVARRFGSRTGSVREQMWVEAYASGRAQELRDRTAVGHRRGGLTVQKKMRQRALEQARLELAAEAYR